MARAIVSLAALLAVGLLVVPGFTQQPTQKSTPPKPSGPAAGSLEDLLSQALRNNPDIRVGEAKVREAEAELNRTRLAVAQKVAGLYHSIDIAQKALDAANNDFARAQELAKRAAISMEDFRKMQWPKEQAAAELVKLQAEMPPLLGKLPGTLSPDKVNSGGSAQLTTPAVEAGVRWLQATLADDTASERALRALALSRYESALSSAPQGTLADKIRKALDKPIEANYKDKPLADVLKEFEKHLDGIPFRNSIAPSYLSGNMDLNLGQVSLGAAIQAFNDVMPDLRFVVRDYGVLLTGAKSLPPGAVDLHDFWKSGANKEKPKRESGEGAKPKQ